MEPSDDFYDFNAEAENTRLDPYTGKPAKFHMDKFHGKDMHILKQEISGEMVNVWLDWLERELPNQFKRNTTFQQIGVLGKPDHLPHLEYPESMETVITRSVEEERLARKKKKERLVLFMFVINQYLQSLTPEQVADNKWTHGYISPYTKHGKLKPGYNKDGTPKDKSK